MYGLLLEGIAEHMKQKYGQDIWLIILAKAGIRHSSFSTHKIYSETLILRLAKVSEEVTGTSHEELMEEFGCSFVTFLSQYGYDRILKVLGRHMRDFLSGLDNLHEYLRFTYPRLKAPSFRTSEETAVGLTMTYRSKRKGFLNYVKGQILQVAKVFYNVDISIQVLKENSNKDSCTVVYRLYFQNSGVTTTGQIDSLGIGYGNLDASLLSGGSLDSKMYFEVFPFHLIFDKTMNIKSSGSALHAIMQDLVGQNIDEIFAIIKPPFDFTWDKILENLNNLFEIITIVPILRDNHEDDTSLTSENQNNEEGRTLHLKGQMIYMDDLDLMSFLGTPVMQDLNDMVKFGLYINDLCMHDSSRDLLLAGTQQSQDLKTAIDQEHLKSRKLAENMKQLDEEVKRTDQLLYQMIPKAVADRLRNGEPSVNTCEIFEAVSILFTDIVNFVSICETLLPMDVITLLNNMYMAFDKIVANHHVYKVETIADAYMIVSGAPVPAKFHAQFLSDATFEIVSASQDLLDPCSQKPLQVRFGIHSGAVVAGVVGTKMPRYCLFGDTVNTASRMLSSSEAYKIHISEMTQRQLQGYPYQVDKRGTIKVKGKGAMDTYWLIGKTQCNYSPMLEVQRLEYEALKRNESSINGSNFINQNKDNLSGNFCKYNPVTVKDVERSQMSLQSRINHKPEGYERDLENIGNVKVVNLETLDSLKKQNDLENKLQEKEQSTKFITTETLNKKDDVLKKEKQLTNSNKPLVIYELCPNKEEELKAHSKLQHVIKNKYMIRSKLCTII